MRRLGPGGNAGEATVSIAGPVGVRTWRAWSGLPQLVRADRVALVAILLYAVLLVILATHLAPGRFLPLFSEEGPFEEASILLWLAASAVVIWRVRPFTARTAVFALLFAAFAAREASWHKAFTADSLLKISYYLKSPASLAEKVLAGLAAAAFIAMLLYAAYVVARFLLLEGGLSSRAGYWVLFAGALFILAKVMDRSPSILHEITGHPLQIGTWRLMKAFEEGFEALTPALFALSAWISRTERPYLS